LQRLAVDFIGSENLPLKSPAGPLQAPTKPTREEDPEKKRRTDFGQTGEEDGTGRRQQIQTGGFTPFSARRCHLPANLRINRHFWNSGQLGTGR
jgi:hypothetical protein